MIDSHEKLFDFFFCFESVIPNKLARSNEVVFYVLIPYLP